MRLVGRLTRAAEVGTALLLTVLAACVGNTPEVGRAHAPCFDCDMDMYNLLEDEASSALQPRQTRQVSGWR